MLCIISTHKRPPKINSIFVRLVGKSGELWSSKKIVELRLSFYYSVFPLHIKCNIFSVFQCIKAIYGQCQAEPKGATNPSTLRQQTLLNSFKLCIFESVFPYLCFSNVFAKVCVSNCIKTNLSKEGHQSFNPPAADAAKYCCCVFSKLYFPKFYR